MRHYFLLALTVMLIALLSPGLAQNTGPGTSSARAAKRPFNPRSFDGVWTGEKRWGNGRFDNLVPEPPLTEWGKQNLLYKSISHDSLSGILADPSKVPDPTVSYDGQRHFYVADLNGVPVNDADGEYPGKDCEPLSTPAMFDYPTFNSMEFVSTPDRIYQLFEYHREWRTWWLNVDHPKDLEPSYEGHSTAHWEGDTLVVDTIGYNGKTMISGAVGHRKSDAFRLVERYRRVDYEHLELEMTFYDPKAWGGKSWTGFHKYFKRVPKESFQEFICSPREYKAYDNEITNSLKESPAK